MASSSQPVDLSLSFDLPVSLARIGTGYLSENPVAVFLISLLALLVLTAVLVVPISALFGIEIFPGLLPHARSLGGGMDLSSVLEELTGSKALEDFLNQPLEDFLKLILPEEGQARATESVGGFLSRAGQALTPVLSVLDYDNAFVAVQVPGEECRQRLMCHVHRQVPQLPRLLQKAYNFLRPHMNHQKQYSRAILTGLTSGDCDLAFPDCSYSVFQMASFVPFLRSKSQHGNQL